MRTYVRSQDDAFRDAAARLDSMFDQSVLPEIQSQRPDSSREPPDYKSPATSTPRTTDVRSRR
jgi:hypothetical protein